MGHRVIDAKAKNEAWNTEIVSGIFLNDLLLGDATKICGGIPDISKVGRSSLLPLALTTSPASHLSFLIFHLPSLVSHLSSTVSHLTPSITRLSSLPFSPWNTNSQGEWWSWPPAGGVEDDGWVRRGELDRQNTEQQQAVRKLRKPGTNKRMAAFSYSVSSGPDASLPPDPHPRPLTAKFRNWKVWTLALRHPLTCPQTSWS